LLASTVPACSEQSVAPSPSPSPSPSPPPSPPPQQPSASLTIEGLSIVVLEGPCSYTYSEPHRCFRPRFIIRETGGASGATIRDAHLEGPDGAEPGSIGGPACPHVKNIRVPPGETSDVYYRDGNSGSNDYCYIWGDLLNSAERRQLDLLIAFTDDDGIRRTFSTTLDVP
jgi:hypothetical protein